MKKYLLLAIISIILVACSDDDNPSNNTIDKNYFPLKDGNYWFYEYYDLDMQNQIKYDTKRNDSIVNGSSVTYLQKNAHPLTQYSWVLGQIPIESGKYHFYTENNKIYSETKYILPGNAIFGLPVDKIENKWIVLADFTANSWDVFSHQFANETISLPGLPSGIKLNANYSVKANRSLNSSKITIGNVNYDAAEIVLNHTIKGNLTYLLFSFPIDIVLIQKFYYVDKIGMARTLLESKKVEINLGQLGTQSIDVPGYIKNLIRYKVQ